MQNEITLTAAAARLKCGYNVALRLVLRGELEGHQDERGRWLVSARSVERRQTVAAA